MKKNEFNKFVLWGSKGGKKTLKNKGKEHFSKIGKMGRQKQLSTIIELKNGKGLVNKI